MERVSYEGAWIEIKLSELVQPLDCFHFRKGAWIEMYVEEIDAELEKVNGKLPQFC